jgi:hypothetical protein
VKRRHLTVLLLILLPCLLIGSVLLAPARVLTPVANLLLAGTGIHVVSLQSVRLGWQGADVAAVTLSLPGYQTDLDGVSLTYRPGELLRGRILTVQIDRIGITTTATEAANGNSDRVLEEQLAPLSRLPFDRADVGELRFHGRREIRASVTMTSAPLLLEARLSLPDFAAWNLALAVQAASAREFIGIARLDRNTGETLQSDFTATVLNDSLALEAETVLNPVPLLSLPGIAGKLNGLAILSEVLQLKGELRLQDLSNQPSLAALTVSLDSPDSLLQVRWEAPELDAQARIHLPLQVRGSASSLLGDLSLAAQELQGDLSMNSGAASMQGDIHLEQLSLLCADPGHCNLAVDSSLAAQRWNAGSITGSDAVLSGAIAVDYSGETAQLHSPLVTLSLPEIQLAEQRAAAAFDLSELALQLATTPALRFNLVSTRLEPGITNLTLTNPQVAGQIQLNAGTLSAGLNFSLDNRLQAILEIDQNLGNEGLGAGSAALTLQEYVFTDSFNLASLVSYGDLNTDLVAGSLSGEATLQWRPGGAGLWQLSGPLTLRLDALSGTVANNFFVGLNTELHARFGTGPTLYTDALQEASLATLDVGLPLNRIDWRYGFDTDAGLVTVQQAHTELLGGSLEIAELQYDTNAEQNRLDIALVELDLATIVALANYPNLQVSGTISGYIPLLLGPAGVTIDRGLISALNPGGSIRYTAANPTSSNATMQLINEALSNYQFEHFDAELNYSETGDMEVAVSLQGMNPELEGGRRINVNVNISDNIPALLRSLQASRAITERLEQRLNRQ